jgi:hypothetical protein
MDFTRTSSGRQRNRVIGTVQPTCTLDRLPNEILYLILDHLPAYDFVHFALAAYVSLRLRIPDVIRYIDVAEVERLRHANERALRRRVGSLVVRTNLSNAPNAPATNQSNTSVNNHISGEDSRHPTRQSSNQPNGRLINPNRGQLRHRNLFGLPRELILTIWEQHLSRRTQMDMGLALWESLCHHRFLTPIRDPVSEIPAELSFSALSFSRLKTCTVVFPISFYPSCT